MWFLSEFLERYTRNIARSVMRVAAAEMEANRNAISGVGLARDKNRMILPERGSNAASTSEVERRASGSPVPTVPQAAAEAAVPLSEAPQAKSPKCAKTLITMETMPVGVRGDLVMRYIEAFSEASSSQAAVLIDKLSKDKKVRIAELQLVVADVLGEAVTRRTKTEHCEVLYRRLAPQALAEITAISAATAPEMRAN